MNLSRSSAQFSGRAGVPSNSSTSRAMLRPSFSRTVTMLAPATLVGGSATVTSTRRHMARIAESTSADSSKDAGLRGSRNSASATQNGMEYCAIMMSVGSGMLFTVAIRSLPATVTRSTCAPLKPCSACSSRIACTAVCAVMCTGKRFRHRFIVANSLPRRCVRSAVSHSVQNTFRKPASPSSTLRGPVNPSAARLAASTPLSAARPRCSRFTIAPVPDRANSISPQASEPAMPSALVIAVASSRNSLPTATAAPKGPVVPGAWKPRRSLLCFVARPMRYITSKPATTAVIRSRPLLPCSCAMASAGGSNVAPGCTPAPGLVRLSDSKAWASAPLASAAAGAWTDGPSVPRIRLLPPAPIRCA